VIPGVTGEFFDELTVDSLAGVLRQFNASAYSPIAIREQALKFDRTVFRREITAFVKERT
jgi:hypothetical protein